MLKNKVSFYWLIAFLEGFAVMAVELIVGQMISAVFGSSVIMWTVVLMLVLIGLCIGYFVGARLAAKEQSKFLVHGIMLAVSISIMFIYSGGVSVLFYPDTITMFLSAIIEAGKLILPTMIFLGMISPILIGEMNSSKHGVGKTAGRVYFVSTIGGILATFVFGFLIIPNMGLKMPLIVLSLFLALVFTVFLVAQKKYWGLAGLFGAVVLFFNVDSDVHNRQEVEVLERIDGVLGEVVLIERKLDSCVVRQLYTNKTKQTEVVFCDDGEQVYTQYISKLKELVNAADNGNKVLILGLGGGAIVKAIEKENRIIEAVEFDSRVIYIAIKYFEVSAETILINDDARHFINSDHTKRDVIVCDVFKGEVNPSHVITMESLQLIKANLSKSGVLIINGNGFVDGAKGRANRSLIKTIQSSGFNLLAIKNGVVANGGNLILIAWKKDGPNMASKFDAVVSSLGYREIDVDVEKDLVITDDNVLMEYLNIEANLDWRRGYLNSVVPNWNHNGISVIH
ncbi:MAG: fused MFS/spermidine synthase [Flavobacteriales bacterium]|nr:fused MFS/spermidine synthase [Flavobacteriales bacterium]